MFVDEIKLSVHSGAGGSGSVSFKKHHQSLLLLADLADLVEV